MTDPFGHALLDHYRGDRDGALLQRDGEEATRVPIEDFYFSDLAGEPGLEWIESQLTGPLVDLGAGTGRHALYFQERFETVALERSEHLLALLDKRGVANVRSGDMFALRETFEADRFRSALALGSQIGLARSLPGLEAFLSDLAAVTTPAATAVLDAYDPSHDDAPGMLGFRSDPRDGLAYRVFHYEYGGDAGRTLLFRLFSPDRLREAVETTDWVVADTDRPFGSYHYRAVLEKR